MEKAVFLSVTDALDTVGNVDRVYYGSETCEHQLPSLPELELVLARMAPLPVTLVTPYLTDRGLARLAPLLAHLQQLWPPGEIVVNDLGLLALLARERSGLAIVCGRLLTPHLLTQNSRARDRLGIQRDLLRELGVQRWEVSYAGAETSYPPSAPIETSLYYPYDLVSTTRLCKFSIAQSSADEERYRRCDRPCGAAVLEIDNPEFGRPLYLRANAFFTKVHRLKGLGEAPISRLVLQPLARTDVPLLAEHLGASSSRLD